MFLHRVCGLVLRRSIWVRFAKTQMPARAPTGEFGQHLPQSIESSAANYYRLGRRLQHGKAAWCDGYAARCGRALSQRALPADRRLRFIKRRSPATRPGLPHPSFPRIRLRHLQVRRRQISGCFRAIRIKRENVAETSRYLLSGINRAAKSPENCLFLTISTAATGAMNRASDGVSPLPVTVPPKRNPKKPRPPVGASSLGTSPAPTDVVIF